MNVINVKLYVIDKYRQEGWGVENRYGWQVSGTSSAPKVQNV